MTPLQGIAETILATCKPAETVNQHKDRHGWLDKMPDQFTRLDVEYVLNCSRTHAHNLAWAACEQGLLTEFCKSKITPTGTKPTIWVKVK